MIKLKTVVACKVKKKLTSSKSEISQMRAERDILGQLVLLSIGHNVDLVLTLLFFLRPVPWSLSTPTAFQPKLTSQNFCISWNHTSNQQHIGHVVLHIALKVMPYYRAEQLSPVTLED